MFQYIKTTLSIIVFSSFYYINAQNTGDTVTFNFFNSKILIISESEIDEWDFEAEEEAEKSNLKKTYTSPEIFLGTNGYTSSLKSFELPEEQINMRINYMRSRTFALNMMLKGIDIKNKRLYISPGLGICWNNYFFENPIRIYNQNDSTLFILDTVTNFKKYKLSSAFLQLPIIIGLRIGNINKKTIGVQFGILAGYRINSKVINHYKQKNSDYKSKEFNSFNLRPLQISTIGRLSIGKIGVYAKYSLTPLFVENSAPDVYPFSLGLMIGGF